ncbi:hypothetical protein [Nocardia sp. NPDC051463]|uniref:hypothetical protein n=1 Tax=Nocardia sp. NPDC051463 TaxID=3154845 RepID=UPI00344BF5BD
MTTTDITRGDIVRIGRGRAEWKVWATPRPNADNYLLYLATQTQRDCPAKLIGPDEVYKLTLIRRSPKD